MELTNANFPRRTYCGWKSRLVPWLSMMHRCDCEKIITTVLIRLIVGTLAWSVLTHTSFAQHDDTPTGYIEGLPVPSSGDGTLCEGINVTEWLGDCGYDSTAIATGQVRWANTHWDAMHKPQPITFKVGGGNHTAVIDNYGYVAPETGDYTITAHICESLEQGGNLISCTIAAAADIIQGRRKVKLTGGEYVGWNDVNGGDRRLVTQGAVSLCYTLDYGGHQYKLSSKLYCQDGEPMPDHKESCHLDGGAQLNVPLGTIRRSDVPLVGHAGAGVSKTIGVTCSGDSALDTVTTFKYTALSGEPSAVATSTDGLGIAVDYNGAPIGSGQGVPGSFASGANTITLNFTPVRSTTVPASQIATGDFTSDLVMIITIQ